MELGSYLQLQADQREDRNCHPCPSNGCGFPLSETPH